MQPFRDEEPVPPPGLAGTPVLLLSGSADPIIPAANSEGLAACLRRAGAEVTYHPLPAGHGLSQMDLSLARHWMAGL
ncbi:alpha/beta hydrolase, partial [Roseomonas sp. DSM 102946]|nr:alpha/beta hydrolase [Roseomonas sp. DSM 102946]